MYRFCAVKYFFQTLEKVTKKNSSKRWFNIMETRSEIGDVAKTDFNGFTDIIYLKDE